MEFRFLIKDALQIAFAVDILKLKILTPTNLKMSFMFDNRSKTLIKVIESFYSDMKIFNMRKCVKIQRKTETICSVGDPTKGKITILD